MSITLIVEDGTIVAGANSYLTTAEADDILAVEIDPTDKWLALADNDKALRLINATQWMDDHIIWLGKRTTDPKVPYRDSWVTPLPPPTPGIPVFPPPSGTTVTPPTPQALGWPRRGARDREGHPVAENVVPKQVKRLAALYANYMLNDDGEQDMLSGGLKRFKADNFEIEYQPGYFPTTAPQFVRFVIQGLGQLGSEPGFKKVKRV